MLSLMQLSLKSLLVCPNHLYASKSILESQFIGDEILFDIRRKAASEKKKTSSPQKEQEHYAIPHGYLYTYISYPNYLCEWLEWLGFALAAAPLPYPLPRGQRTATSLPGSIRLRC